MAAQTVSFTNPAALIAPDLAVQEQQIQRQQALAQALREQAMAGPQVKSGAMSWTQGLAQLADALASKRILKKSDAQQIDINRQYAGALRGMFGVPSAGGGDPSASGQGAPQGDLRDPNPNRTYEEAKRYYLRGADIPQPGGPQAQAPSPAPAEMPQASTPPQPVAPQQAPQPIASAPQRGAWSLTGDPQRDFALYMANPEEYGKQLQAVAAKGAMPTDIETTVAHAKDALARGDVATATALLGNLQKQNYIAPVNARGGSWTVDPITKERRYNPNLPEGAQPQLDDQGNVTSVSPIPGVFAIEGGKAKAQGQGKLYGESQSVLGPDGNWHPSTVGDNLGGAVGGGAKGPGPLSQTFGGGSPIVGVGPGRNEALKSQGTQSAQAFQGISTAATGSQERLFQLDKIDQLARESRFGPGSGAWATLGGYINTALGKDVINPKNANDYAEFSKYATQLAANQSQALGLNGTDAKFGAILAAVPNPHLQNGAIHALSSYFRDNEFAIQAKANAAAAWAQTHPEDNMGFEKAWRSAFNRQNPIDVHMIHAVQQGPEYFKKQIQMLDPKARAYAIEKYKQLKAMGAFGG